MKDSWKRQVVVGTRPSRLAFKQVEEIGQQLPDIRFKVVPIVTKGDRDKETALVYRENTDFFTYEIEQALLKGKIDAAVHSAKDLEENTPEDLMIVALTPSVSPYDCLVSRGGVSLRELAWGAVIGTSSRNRKEAVLRFRDDLVVKDIRGNVDERLAQFDAGKFDAVIIAHAALIRLGYQHRIAQIIPSKIIEPHPLQGRLAVQIHHHRGDLAKILRSLDAS